MDIQLEFNFDNKTPEQMTLSLMQKQIDKIFTTTDKVRKKLFSELGEVKKTCLALKQENDELKSILREIGYGKTEWSYRQRDCLFDVRKHQEAVG